MIFSEGDEVYVSNPKLETFGSNGVVTNTNDNLVTVRLKGDFVQHRTGKVSKYVKYAQSSLQLLSQKIDEIQDNGVVVVVCSNFIDSYGTSLIERSVLCCNVDDARKEAARIIQRDPNKYYWVSITKPHKVELVEFEPTIRKVA